MTADHVERRLAAILAADVAGYSQMMGADEEGTLARLTAHRRELFDPAIARHRGRIVKTTGDGLLAEFGSVVDAVRCAAEVQTAMAKRNTTGGDALRLEFRIGINVGDIVEQDGDIFGDGVNIAARLESIADPGGICVSARVQEDAFGKTGVSFEDLGEQALKNIARPIRAYRVQIAGTTPAPAAQPARGLPERPSLAVLPFQNMSGDAEQDYFADGMVEDIITALSRFKELLVIARNSSFVYKGRAVDIQQVARELGVRYVLEGSVRKGGNRLRITGQLIDAATRGHLWADRFDGVLEEVFDLQDRITESVVGALQPALRQAEIERTRRKPPASLDAYDYLLRATPYVIANTYTEAVQAIPLLQEAIRLDPTYAHAHGLLANAYGQILRSAQGEEREATRTISLMHARRAIALGPDDSTALAYAGFLLLLAAHDAAGARAALDKAVALNPGSAAALTYRSMVLAMSGEAHAAIADAEKALRLSPLDPANYLPNMGMVVAHITLNQFEDAANRARKVIEINPSYPMSYAWLMVAECGRGNREEARTAFGRLAEILPDLGPERLAMLFEVFPPDLRRRSIAILHASGFVPALEQEG